MLYRATHDIFFYIAIGACIIFSLLIIGFSGSKLKNHESIISAPMSIIIQFPEKMSYTGIQ